MGKELLLKTLPSIIDGTNQRIKQNDEYSSYAWNIKREEERITYNKPAKDVYNQIRGLYPWPTANTIINEVEVKVLEAKISDKDSTFSPGTICEINKDSIGVCTKDKVILITKVKPFGKKAMDAKDYINGLNKEKTLHSIAE
jgi:methionyl-tRNA formyltransferase